MIPRVAPKYEKLSDQAPNWPIFSLHPKGQLGEILANSE